MSRAVRFAIGLIAGLGLLTWAALVIVQRTTRAWFEKDVSLRAELAVGGARAALGPRWGGAGSAPRRRCPAPPRESSRLSRGVRLCAHRATDPASGGVAGALVEKL